MDKKRLYILLIGLSLGGYIWVGWNVVERPPAQTICMFKAVTHLPCRSCGTTRACVMLMQGDVWGSLLVNPFGAILALALVTIPLWIISDLLSNRDSLFRWYVSMEGSLARNKLISVPAIVIVAVNWFWNISKGL